MSEMVERVARALRGESYEIIELIDQIRKNKIPMSQKEILDCRELSWFKEHRGWIPASGDNIEAWLQNMRVRDETLSDGGDFAPDCGRPGCADCQYNRAMAALK